MLCGSSEWNRPMHRLSSPDVRRAQSRLLMRLRRQTPDVAAIDDLSRLPRPSTRSPPIPSTRGGDLALAKRASMAVPGVFAPIRVDGRLVVDGGPAQNR
jgi:NTE family protein